MKKMAKEKFYRSSHFDLFDFGRIFQIEIIRNDNNEQSVVIGHGFLFQIKKQEEKQTKSQDH